MKKTIIFIVLNLFSLCLLNAQTFYIKGETTNSYNEKVYISYYSELLKKSVTDSCIVKDLHFQFEGIINMPAFALLSTTNSRDLTNTSILFIEPDEMFVSIHTEKMQDAKLTGSYSGRVYDTLKIFKQN